MIKIENLIWNSRYIEINKNIIKILTFKLVLIIFHEIFQVKEEKDDI